MARRWTCAWIAVVAVTTLTPSSRAADLSGFRIRMSSSRHSTSILRAAAGAYERLGRAECQKLFTDFNDQSGRPLQERLDTLELNGQEFLRYVGFYEGYGRRRCGQAQVMAFTQPGSLAVHVCPQIGRQDQEMVEMIVIHEMLHSLGLGENPPTTSEITKQVTKRCGGQEKPPSVRTAKR